MSRPGIRSLLVVASVGVAALAGAGCSSDVLLVEVTANPPIPGVTAIGVTVTVMSGQGSGQTPTHDPITLDATPRTFGVSIPSSRRAGMATLHVCALAPTPTGCTDLVVDDLGAAIDAGRSIKAALGSAPAGGDMATPTDGGAPGHKDGWSEECGRAIACLDFQDQMLHGLTTNSLNATVGVAEGNAGNYVLRAVPQSAGMIRAILAGPVDTTQASDGLWLKFRLRVATTAGAQNFDLVELYSQPTNTSVLLGVYDQAVDLAGRRTGTSPSSWTSRQPLDGNWHCLAWKVLGGRGTSSDLWFDGMPLPAFHFTSLEPLDFNRVQFGLVAPARLGAADSVMFDDIVITTSAPSHDCY